MATVFLAQLSQGLEDVAFAFLGGGQAGFEIFSQFFGARVVGYPPAQEIDLAHAALAGWRFGFQFHQHLLHTQALFHIRIGVVGDETEQPIDRFITVFAEHRVGFVTNALPAQFVDAAVAGNGVDPGVELAGAVEALPVGKDLESHVLDDVVRQLVVYPEVVAGSQSNFSELGHQFVPNPEVLARHAPEEFFAFHRSPQ